MVLGYVPSLSVGFFCLSLVFLSLVGLVFVFVVLLFLFLFVWFLFGLVFDTFLVDFLWLA